MVNGLCSHSIVFAGYGSGGGGGGGDYSRGRNDRGDGGGGGYSRGRNESSSQSDDRGGGGYNRSRNDHQETSGGGDDNAMETQHDTIFIQNLPRGVTTDELREVFAQIGVIKVSRSRIVLDHYSTHLVDFMQNDRKTNTPKIWVYKDKATGEGKGEATITYEDEEAAQAAINWYNGNRVSFE